MSPRLKTVLRAAASPVWRLLGAVVPKRARQIAINSFPDFDDTTRALAVAARDLGADLVVLTTRPGQAAPPWLDGVRVKIAHRYSVRGVWLYHRSRYVLFTHGCFSAWRPSGRQVVVNVWHGMPLKRIGLLDGKPRSELPRFHYTIASDERFHPIIAAAFGVDGERVLVADHPRTDVLRAGADRAALALPQHRHFVLWLPTYRASITGDVRSDGDEAADILSGKVDLRAVDEACARNGILCIVKPHPMARVHERVFAPYRALRLVTDADLAARGLSLYQLLAASDALITDVSSVYFDYKALGRPVALYCPDLERYAATRGFVAPIETLVSDPVDRTQEELAARLEALCRTGRLGASSTPPGGGPQATRSLLLRLGFPPRPSGAA